MGRGRKGKGVSEGDRGSRQREERKGQEEGMEREREGREKQEEIGEEGNVVAPPILCTRFVAHQG